ncbi:MAG: hypothetical protein IB618_03990 [Candidatus Pacearchaeota archaeon]|nr:MAG: hypothetical protein IB618_03990 [Candidatus Pacearchaeota archaeon]
MKGLAALKKEYEKYRKKYKLPRFSELNQEFEIEKIQEKETEFLLREIRRAISDKIAAFLRFFELFLNPTTAPVFILALLKTLNVRDKELVEKIYHNLVAFELTAITLDIVYNEKKEAEFIRYIFKKWQGFKKELIEFSRVIERTKTKAREKKRKSYFG